MDFGEVFSAVADQDRGAEFELRHPVTGEPTGLKIRIAGPDSTVQRRARLALQDRLIEAGMHISAEERERFSIEMLASVALGWDVSEDGQPVEFVQRNIVRLLSVLWIREQVDNFASNRAPYMGVA